MSNIYGGMTIQGSPFIIDKIYDNYAAAVDAAADDGIYVGRYVMIQYCDDILDYYIRSSIESAVKNGTGSGWTNDKHNYYTNYKVDYDYSNSTYSYDRTILKKIYKDNKLQYELICCLHPMSGSAYTDDTMTAVGVINSLNIGNGQGSHSVRTGREASYTEANGDFSFATGIISQANGIASSAFGLETQANENYSMAIGQYNQTTIPSLFCIGNGSSDNRKDAFTIDTHNNVIINVNTPSYIKGWTIDSYTVQTITDTTEGEITVYTIILNIDDVNKKFSIGGTVYLIQSGSTWSATVKSTGTNYLQVTKLQGSDSDSVAIDFIYLNTKTGPDTWYPNNSVLLGEHTYFNNKYSLSVGINNETMGIASIAIGYYNYSMGENSFAQGHSSQAYGHNSFAQGYATKALSRCASAFGEQTIAEGYSSSTFGIQTKALGRASSAFGSYTQAALKNSMVVGQWNDPDIKALFSVGIGTGSTNKLTGFCVDPDGMAYLPIVTVDSIKADITGKSIVTKEYIDVLQEQTNAAIAKIQDYIIDSGIVTITAQWNSAPTSQEDSDNYNQQKDIVLYYEKWASGRAICRCSGSSFVYSSLAKGKGGGHYVALRINLPETLFEYSRDPAIVSVPQWEFSHCMDNSSGTSPSLAAQDYIHLTCWENNAFGDNGITPYTQLTSTVTIKFYAEAFGFWKNPNE